MKQWIKIAVPVAIGLITLSASAIPINGTVRMSGDVTLDSQSLNSATKASFVNPAGTVSSGTGSYATTAGASVNFNNFTFFPLASQSTPVNPLWSFVSGGFTYSFSLANIGSESVTANEFLTMTGTGTVSITGAGSPFDSTVANWSFTITDTSGGNSGSFVFGFAQSDTSVPDGGMTIMLLGAALTGLSLIKRKLVA
jgi:hypothetical protein